MPARHQVESYKFWDIVTLWAKEQLEAEEVIARALAKAVIRDGLRLQSTDIRWAKGKGSVLELKEHLLGVVRQARRSGLRGTKVPSNRSIATKATGPRDSS
jgi:hypothetical protein